MRWPSSCCFSPPPADAQQLWVGDFRDANFYQFKHVHCGAWEGAGPCPYNQQTANVDTTLNSVNCSAGGTFGCRFSLTASPTNATAYSNDFAPTGSALKIVVAHNPSAATLDGDTAPVAGNPWGDSHRNELKHARDPATGNFINHGEGEERFYGWSTYVPGTGDFANPNLNQQQDWHVAMQFHQAGACGPPYIDVGIKRLSGTEWKWALNTIENYPEDNAVELWPLAGTPTSVARERLYNFVLRVKWSTSATVGRVTLWVDGTQVYDGIRKTLFNFNPHHPVTNPGGCELDGAQTGTMTAVTDRPPTS